MDWLVSFLIAVLSGMGVGSAGLLIIYLTTLGIMNQFSAQGLNLLFFLFATVSSLIIHVRKRRLYYDIIITAVICAVPGVLLGGYIAKILSVELLRKLFGGMLVIAGSLSVSNIIKEVRVRRSERNSGG